jgi:hypothetical protein
MYKKFDRITIDYDSLQRLLDGRNNTLPNETTVAMDKLKRAVMKGKPNKAPGWDGISNDFFRTVWDTIKHELLEVVNDMYRDGQVSVNQKHGMIVCVPKKPRPMRTDDYRHLTLLNTDFKLLARIISNRIHPWATTILHPSQYCGLQDHNIFEAVAGVREAIAYAECTRSSICILSLDFKEAFDKMSHEYLLSMLGRCGFGSCF